jgi:hypothetical protein
VRIEIAADDEPQAVGDEHQHVDIGEEVRILLEERTLVRDLEG